MGLLSPFIARGLVRSMPFVTQQTFRDAALANAGTMVAEYDLCGGVTDQNRLLSGAYPGAAAPQRAIGPYLDALVWVTGTSTLLVEYAVDQSCAYHSIGTITTVPASTLTNISGLRVTGRFVRITLTNTSGGAILAELGTYIRST